LVEDNWLGGQRIGDSSFDATAGTLNELLFNFQHPLGKRLFLDPSTGLPTTPGQLGGRQAGHGGQ
jgi:phospholipase C